MSGLLWMARAMSARSVESLNTRCHDLSPNDAPCGAASPRIAPGGLIEGEPGSGPITQELANNTQGSSNGRIWFGIWRGEIGRLVGGATIPFGIARVN